MRRLTALILVFLMILPTLSALAEDEWPFAIRNGSRDSNKIAITVDDCYDKDWVRAMYELAVSEGVHITFFPLGEQLKVEDRELWRELAESPSVEIGSHTQHHTYFKAMSASGIQTHLRRTQECLDEALGYHYEIKSMRPPFGGYTDDDGSSRRIRKAVQGYGYDHVILWDVSQTNPDKAIKKVKNGSILLYHTHKKDYNCLVKLIPALKEKGFEMVTVSELLGFEGTGIQDVTESTEAAAG